MENIGQPASNIYHSVCEMRVGDLHPRTSGMQISRPMSYREFVLAALTRSDQVDLRELVAKWACWFLGPSHWEHV